jgi:glutamate/tyrosine decarboxylase-like PLP-dependent enzyme
LIEQCCDNATMFAAWLRQTDGLELLAPVPLNIVCWRYTPAGLDEAATDAFNRAAVTALQTSGPVFVSPTSWQGRPALRCAFDNWLTTAGDVAILQEAVSNEL